MNFYMVTEGNTELANPDDDFDGVESVLVAAESAEEALQAAKQYDAGLIDIDNIWLPDEGRAVAALRSRD